ncbi:hypothetical protein [Halocatena halophila]|uniref:hypothetical protein n=1 Tax=Halocatena halophila TaxID=2814576 RepID=UPI002ED02663
MVPPLTTTATWLPDREPSRVDRFLWIPIGFMFVIQFIEPSSGWLVPWLAVGAVLSALATGPIAKTPFGQRISSWFEAIGAGGRFVLIAGFAVGIVVAFITTPSLVDPGHSVGTGMLLWHLVLVPVWIVHLNRTE